MPIRIGRAASLGRVGRISGTLGDITGSAVGTYVAPTNVSGVLKPVLADVTGGVSGYFLASAQRTGTFSGTLGNVTGGFVGAYDTPASWTDSLGNSFSINQGTSFSYTFTATDPDPNDPITITNTSLPTGMTATIQTQVGVNRSIVLAGNTSVPAGVYTVTINAT